MTRDDNERQELRVGDIIIEAIGFIKKNVRDIPKTNNAAGK